MNDSPIPNDTVMNRREMLKSGGAFLLAGAAASAAAGRPLGEQPPPSGSVERWDVFELTLAGPQDGNPYVDRWLSAVFRLGAREVPVNGFYDGNGIYKVRFMPDVVGHWTYTTRSNAPALDGRTGALAVTPAGPGNHGPVRVRDIFHFGYADGTPYFPFGTTCYAWVQQPDATQAETLATLKGGPFNKLRMCIFPKWYEYNRAEPPRYPFPRHGETNDYSRFNPEYFRSIEKRVLDLRALGVEADLILFHPYDHWGYQDMPAEVDDRYVKYMLARFGAFRNVWWSLANEYDLLRKKTNADWDRIADLVCQFDPYAHLRSIHYSRAPYDYTRVWCTHAGVQSTAFGRAAEWRETYRKPVIFDEMQYEGNIESRWGNLSGEELTRRFWLCTVAGAYGGHGETYIDRGDIGGSGAVLWWAHGGKLHGSSPERIAFLRRIVEECATIGGGEIGFTQLNPLYYPAAKRTRGEALLYYFDDHQPLYYDFPLPDHGSYRADLIDPWSMTITPVAGTFTGRSRIVLPSKPYQAVRFVRI